MREGLLWYDPDPRRPTAEKIAAAAARYRERFGRGPNCCHLHPSEPVEDAPLHVVPDSGILRHHFLVGVDETLPRVVRRATGRAPGAKAGAA